MSSDMADRIAAVYTQYDAQGVHRTGTEVDFQSADWLADQVRDAGLQPDLQSLPFSRLDVQRASIDIQGESIEGLPFFDGGFTDRDGVQGGLGPAFSDAAIGVARVGPTGPTRDTFHQKRGESAHLGLVVATGGPEFGLPAGLTPINADRYGTPYGPPVLQIGSEHWAWLEDEARRGSMATLVCTVERFDLNVVNVVATLQGANPSLPPLVVMTPRSGWWNCASERGGGIAVWLEIMRALVAVQPARSVHFVASTGHELGHVGLDFFLAQHPDWIQNATAWIHLGANFGTAIGSAVRLQASDAQLQDLAMAAMEKRAAPPDVLTPVGQRPYGEARNIFDGAGRYISLLGSNGVFHHPDDRWPDAVDLSKTVLLAESFIDIASQLASA